MIPKKEIYKIKCHICKDIIKPVKELTIQKQQKGILPKDFHVKYHNCKPHCPSCFNESKLTPTQLSRKQYQERKFKGQQLKWYTLK